LHACLVSILFTSYNNLALQHKERRLSGFPMF
jgi:hypothetical protein